MATYKDIQIWVKAQFGITIKTCWIADMKNRYHLVTRQAPNRIDHKNRKYPCPPDKKEAIIAAFKHFEMI